MSRYCYNCIFSCVLFSLSLSSFFASGATSNSLKKGEDSEGKKNIIQAFDIVREEMKRQQKTLDIMKSAVNSYAPYSYKEKPFFGKYVKCYIPHFFEEWERQDYDGDSYIPQEIYNKLMRITGGYRWLYLKSKVWTGEYFIAVIQNKRLFSIRAYLKSENSSLRFYSREKWSLEMKARFEILLRSKSEQEKIRSVKKMREISNPKWYLEVFSRELPCSICEKIDEIMNRFKNKVVSAKRNDDIIDAARLDDSYSFMGGGGLDGSAEYHFYGNNSEIFGVSLLDRLLYEYCINCGWTPPSKLVSYFFEFLGLDVFRQNMSQKDVEDECEFMLDQMK